MRWFLIWVLTALPALAERGKAGEFDYYLLSLSWSPNWCALHGYARNSEQCAEGRAFGWVLHGLWPQYHRGYPSFCRSAEAPPTRGMTAAMADVMGTAGLAWHQWRKHGVCTGLSAADYYALSRQAFEQVKRPQIFRQIDRRMQLPAAVVEAAFLEANPDWTPDMLTITCTEGHIQEARLCLSRGLTPVPCGQDVVRDCRMRDAVFEPVK